MDVWKSKKNVLEEGGTRAIEQLSEALSTTAISSRLAEEILQESMTNCYEQVIYIIIF